MVRRFAEGVIRHRLLVIGLTLVATAALALPIKHLRVDIDPNAMLPQSHPYVLTTNQVERVFGSKYVVVIGITPRQGDVFSPHVLGKVERITAALRDTPGVVPGGVLSLSARRAKGMAATADGMEVHRLMEQVPRTPAEIEALRQAVRANPIYLDAIVSRDERTTAIFAEFRDPAGGFRSMMDKVRPIVDREREPSVEIAIGGHPVFLAEMERFSQRMGVLFPLAVLITGLIHWEAFRTLQGLFLPLVTALLAVVWGLGIMALAGVPLDVFNVTTPILILAVAAGHAVQILKRYYEEYHRLRATSGLSPRDANRAAVVEAMTRIGPVMLTAGSVAALSFFSLVVFEIATIRTFGVFTALGIVSALVLEMTFIPAVRSWLPAPGLREARRERARTIWDRITGAIADGVTGPRRRRVDVGLALVLAVSLVGIGRVVVDNSMKSYFAPGLAFQRDDRALNERLGGTNRLYVVVEGRGEDAMKDPARLRGMEATQRFLEEQPGVGKTISLADFVKRMNRALHGDDPTQDRIPESRELVSQLLLLHSMSGEPGDLDAYVDYPYQSGNIWVFLRTDATAAVQELIARLNAFLPGQFGADARIGIGGSVPMAVALTEVMVRGKIMNIVQIAGVIFLISSVVFRSLVAGALVLAPLGLAVVATFGLMGLTGIPLNIPTSVVSAMAVGIGADYAIYFIARLREELRRGADESHAVRTTLATAGKSILFVATAVAGGYGVLLLSWDFRLHTWLAILIAASMLVSSVGSLIVLPRLIGHLHPRFIFGRPRTRLFRAPGAVAVLLGGVAFWLLPDLALAGSPAAREVMARSFIAGKVLDSVAEGTLTVINPSGQERVRRTFGTTKLQPNGVDSMRMLRFLSPPDVRGTVTLLIERSSGDDDMWIYLPAFRRVKRLAAPDKKDSFVGTDFSYGDVLGHKVEDWEHRLLREETLDGQLCYVIQSLPRNGSVRSTSGYSKRVEWIRKDNHVTIRAALWDLSGQPLKTFTATDVKLVDPTRGKWQPMLMEMANLQTGHRTVIRYESFRANQRIKDDFFTVRYMEREP